MRIEFRKNKKKRNAPQKKCEYEPNQRKEQFSIVRNQPETPEDGRDFENDNLYVGDFERAHIGNDEFLENS